MPAPTDGAGKRAAARAAQPAAEGSSSPARRGFEKLVARARAEEAAERAASPEESTGSRWKRLNMLYMEEDGEAAADGGGREGVG